MISDCSTSRRHWAWGYLWHSLELISDGLIEIPIVVMMSRL